jgi:quinol monooxygenase YgiN
MSVLVVMKVSGDTDEFESYISENGDAIEELSERAKAAGCTAHRFGVGDGYVMVVDEWGSAAAFEEFISSPEIQATMGNMGAQGLPEITYSDAKGFPGEF